MAAFKMILNAPPATEDGYRIVTVADQWAEFLPPRVPLRFSFFRYLGFCVQSIKNGKATIVKGRSIGCLRVKIQNEEKTIFNDKIQNAFKNGVYYVQDIRLDNGGLHKITIHVEGPIAAKVAPMVLETHVYEFMTLEECRELQHEGPYAPLRAFVQRICKQEDAETLRLDAVRDAFVRSKAHQLRLIDAQWWLKTFVEHTLDREERAKALQKKSLQGRSSHKRKQEHPTRAADEREHDHLFERRRREWKRLRNGELRMFTQEPLHASATLTLYSTAQMYRQLSLYAQV